MKLDQVNFEGGCCAGHGHAEVQTANGWLAIMKNREDGSYQVRQFDKDKKPVSDGFELMDADQVESLLQ